MFYLGVRKTMKEEEGYGVELGEERVYNRKKSEGYERKNETEENM